MRKIKELELYIFENQSVSPKELMEKFNLSESTVRRYISELMNMGSIRKGYGVIYANTKDQLLTFKARMNIQAEGKRKISRMASEFINEGDVVFVDSGSTHMFLPEAIKSKKDITVFTNNIMFSMKMANTAEHVKVVLIPGSVNKNTLSLTGETSLAFLDAYHFDKGFFTASGVTMTTGYSNRTLPEKDIKSFLMRRIDEKFMLVDDSKFGLSFPFSFGKIPDFHRILTNEKPDQSFLDGLKEQNVEILW
ncbi:DeoR/GlpR family DNA-binding transcription regulator [Proteiniclasticum sp. C24MP]|uniref:DeoR/GlpR family DNA-binding transcription regulator n=1 Tax=Proteiniclasticum sp. C24MP TaxID=3374101 RepID=UPI003754D120